jgi:hypothetical protein
MRQSDATRFDGLGQNPERGTAMRRSFLALACLVAVAACAAEPPRVANEVPPGVSYRFSGDNVADANARADRYCAQYGKHARLQTVNRASADNIAVYECS